MSRLLSQRRWTATCPCSSADNYKTNGRVKGVIGIQYLTGQFGPFNHEILHYWAAYLDPQFGVDNPHWGFAGLHGQLGGFDAATLACETPKGAQPPGCTALGNGRTAYSVGVFAPNANGPSIPYAPFELYLMGLLPVAQVPPQIELLSAASVRSNSYNPKTGTESVEATALKSIAVSDIVARHGQVPLLSNDQRGFRAAFVVLSATPVSDALLSELSSWSAALGNRVANPDLKSFEFVTGGRATLDTRLGPRRDANAPPPTVRAPFKCDLTHENCAPLGTGLSCYSNGQQSFCAIPGSAKRGEPCSQNADCIAQHECRYGTVSTKPVCEPRCDSLDNSSAISCSKLCPNNYILLGTPDGQLLAADCKAP